VDAVIAAGNVYINDFAIPATGDALTEAYTVNEDSSTLEKTENGWTVSGTEYTTYAEAAKALISDELPGGLAIDLYDTDADGKAEVVKIWYTEGLIVNKITKNDDGSYSVFRGDLARVPTYAGRLYDAEHFSATSGEVIKAENFDTSIQEGDGAIFYKTPDGWIFERATEANGIFVEGIDHEYYQIDDETYNDAMKYSRGNLIIAQRNGEFANAHTYFGFKANTQGLKVSLWLDPKSDAPIGLTSNDNARTFLASAIEQSKAKLAAVTLTEQSTDEQKLSYSALEEAIQLAETTLADANSSNSECDFSVYYLYLTLAGTSGDIGAAFAGFYGVNGWDTQNPYQGFDSYFGNTSGDQNGADNKGDGNVSTDSQPAENTPAQSETPATQTPATQTPATQAPAVETPAAQTPAVQTPAAAASTTYTVVKGDCLWNIAKKVYGSGTQFGKIAEANGIGFPYTIYVGQTLIIPAK
jgi:nucleoid-associated protein YgaU